VSIFISIASYRDPLLGFTIASAYDNAKYPQNLCFAVIDQNTADAASLVPDHIPAEQVQYLKIEASQSKGCCWARSLAMSMYRDEDYYLQVDSHSLFAQNWDEVLVQRMQVCLRHSPLAVISSYPPGFTFVGDVATPSSDTPVVSAVVVGPGMTFGSEHPCLLFKSKKLVNVGAVQGYHVSAGCLFAPGKFVQQIPYDPYLYFNEEEQNLALRLYTHGWDIYPFTTCTTWSRKRSVWIIAACTGKTRLTKGPKSQPGGHRLKGLRHAWLLCCGVTQKSWESTVLEPSAAFRTTRRCAG
jgi:hypothetical protein